MTKWYTTNQIENAGICSKSRMGDFCHAGLIPGAKQGERNQWKIPKEIYDILLKAHDKDIVIQNAVEHLDIVKNIPEDSCTVSTAISIIGCSKPTLYRYFSLGKIPGVINIGKQYVLSKEAVDICKAIYDGDISFSEINEHHDRIEHTNDSCVVIDKEEWDAKVTSEQIKYLDKQKATSKEKTLYLYLLATGGSYTEMQPLNVKETAENLNIMVSAIYSLMSSMDTKHIIYALHNYTDQLTYRLIKPTQDCYSKMINKPEIPTPTPESKFEPEPESLADPESDPSTPPEPETSATSSATIQGHELRLESVDAFELLTQGYDALHLLKNTIGGRTDKDMTAAYTQLDDICKSLAALRPDIEAINDYTYTLVYLDGSPNPAAFPVRKQSSEGAVA